MSFVDFLSFLLDFFVFLVLLLDSRLRRRGDADDRAGEAEGDRGGEAGRGRAGEAGPIIIRGNIFCESYYAGGSHKTR